MCPLDKNRGNGQRRNTYRRKPLEKSSSSKWGGRHIDILEVKKTMPFIKKLLIKLQLKLEIQREATNKEKWHIDRRQRVVVDGKVSNWKSVLSEVPHGSVLGPILFLVHISDFDDGITIMVLKFADDTKVLRKI